MLKAENEGKVEVDKRFGRGERDSWSIGRNSLMSFGVVRLASFRQGINLILQIDISLDNE